MIARVDLVVAGAVKGSLKMVTEFFIVEASCLKTTPDQV